MPAASATASTAGLRADTAAGRTIVVLSLVWAVALFGVTIGLLGADHGSVSMIVRLTARTSGLLFAGVFAGAALARLAPGPFTLWLAAARSNLLRAVLVSHLAHLVSLTWLSRLPGANPPATAEVVGGGVAYVLLFYLVGTSFECCSGLLAKPMWRITGVIGEWYISIIFALNFVGLVFARSPLVYAPFALAAVGSIAIRLLARARPQGA